MSGAEDEAVTIDDLIRLRLSGASEAVERAMLDHLIAKYSPELARAIRGSAKRAEGQG